MDYRLEDWFELKAASKCSLSRLMEIKELLEGNDTQSLQEGGPGPQFYQSNIDFFAEEKEELPRNWKANHLRVKLTKEMKRGDKNEEIWEHIP